ncbi:MAG TPA: DUF1674 domain-containing protein [Azospirillaceae bacterium]|nr:DUF1674 domain-containing protein [Azospirillaceae bacterium]
MTDRKSENTATPATPEAASGTAVPEAAPPPANPQPPKVAEIGGPKGPEPTRFGDWEHKGRCIDF